MSQLRGKEKIADRLAREMLGETVEQPDGGPFLSAPVGRRSAFLRPLAYGRWRSLLTHVGVIRSLSHGHPNLTSAAPGQTGLTLNDLIR